jgi:5-methylcytosine-specific restriction endonuclease McrA
MRKCLVLNSWFLPCRIVNWQDAITSLCLDKAEMIVAYDEKIHSPSTTMELPAVIRMKSNRSRNKRSIRFSRQNVYLRDNYTCQYCGRQLHPKELTYDHVVPRSAGGIREWTNITTCCLECNKFKGSRTCDQWGRWPINEPKQPKTLPIIGLPIEKETAPVEWHGFIK